MWAGFRRILALVLKWSVGKNSLPQHVAFIMDGNRRFANLQHIGKLDGHSLGYTKMVEVIHWCLELGVRCISVYAFSIDNFQRSPDEVAALMQLAEKKYKELAQEDDLAECKGVQIRILGDLDLVPASVCGAAARLMQATAELCNKQAMLNICFAYTSTEETVHAVDLMQHAQHANCIAQEDVTPELLGHCLRTQGCPQVDLLIRTSGETRLSDFLVWQTSHAHLAFVNRLWPDFSFTDFIRCILNYQRHAAALRQLRQHSQPGHKHTTKQQQQQPPSPTAAASLVHALLPTAGQCSLLVLVPCMWRSAILSLKASIHYVALALEHSFSTVMAFALKALTMVVLWVFGWLKAGLHLSNLGTPLNQLLKSASSGKGAGLSKVTSDSDLKSRSCQISKPCQQLLSQLSFNTRVPPPIQMQELASPTHPSSSATLQGIGHLHHHLRTEQPHSQQAQARQGTGHHQPQAPQAQVKQCHGHHGREHHPLQGQQAELQRHSEQQQLQPGISTQAAPLQCDVRHHSDSPQTELQQSHIHNTHQQLGINGQAERACAAQCAWQADKDAGLSASLPLHVRNLLQLQHEHHEEWLEVHAQLT